MVKKLIIGLALSMLTALIICPTTSLANAESSLSPNEGKKISAKRARHLRESKSSISHQRLMESFEGTEEGTFVYPDYYGGSYVDDNGDYVVCIVNGSTKEKENALKSIKDTINSSDFKNTDVTYSYNELEGMMDFLNEYILKCTNSTIAKNSPGHYLSVRDNSIFVELIDMSEDQIALYKKEVTDSPIITFKKSAGVAINCADENTENSASTGYRVGWIEELLLLQLVIWGLWGIK